MRDAGDAAIQTLTTQTLARVYAKGIADGCAAASADSPAFLNYQVMVYMAWDASCEQPDVQPSAEQEEYFVAWVHGYVCRADEMESTPATREVVSE
ncbi:MAG TPA: hypothetical protein VF818_10730 [Ktedonobacterales bacterium]